MGNSMGGLFVRCSDVVFASIHEAAKAEGRSVSNYLVNLHREKLEGGVVKVSGSYAGTDGLRSGVCVTPDPVFVPDDEENRIEEEIQV